MHFFRDDYGVEPESSGNFTSGYLCVQRSAFYSFVSVCTITCTNIIFCFRILIVYNIVWATLFATITGIMTIDKRYLDKAATLELKGMKRITKVILPAASPSILAGFVNSLRSSFVMLVYAEMYGAGEGMGYFVKKYAELGILLIHG